MTIHQWPSPKQFYGPTDHAANTPDQTPKLPRCPRPTPRRQRCRGGRDVITANAHVCTRPFGTTPPSSIRPMRASGGARRRATGTWAESPGEVTLPSRVVERGKPRTGNDSNCPCREERKGAIDLHEVEEHWGLFRSDRTPQGVLASNEETPACDRRWTLDVSV